MNLYDELETASYSGDFEEVKKGLKQITYLAIEGCKIDGEHHKQWYLEQIIDALGWDIAAVRGEEWEPGIAP